jgi:hypothetical protein
VFTNTATDADKAIAVEGAGTAGATLVTTIATVTSPTQATLTANAATTYKYGWMKFGSDDTTAIQAAITWASDNEGKVHFPGGTYMYAGESVLEDSGLIEGDGSWVTMFTSIPGYSGGWFLTLNDTWNNSTPNPIGGLDGGLGASSIGLSPTDFHTGPVLEGFSVVGQRTLDPSGTHGIRTYNRVDRLFIQDVAAYYLNGTGVSLGLEGGTDYSAVGPMGTVRESHFFRLIVRGCGEAGTYKAFELGSQQPDANSQAWADPSNMLAFYSLMLVYNYGESGIYDNTDRNVAGTRSIRFYDAEIHGFANYGDDLQLEAIDPDMFVIEGDVRDIAATDLWINGGTPDGAQIRIKASDTTTYYPKNIKLDHQARQYYKDAIVIEKADNVRIQGEIDGENEPVDGYAVNIYPDAIVTSAIIDVLGMNAPKINITGNDYAKTEFRRWDTYKGPGLFTQVDADTFEAGLDGWAFSDDGNDTPDSRNNRATGNAYAGSYAVGVFGSYTFENPEEGFGGAKLTQTFTEPAGDYYLTFFAKSTSSTSGDVNVGVYNADTASYVANIGITSTTYQHYAVPITLDGSTALSIVNTEYAYANQEGFYIDNIVVLKVAPVNGDTLLFDSAANNWIASAFTLVDGAVDEAHLNATNTASSGYFLTSDGGSGFTWVAGGAVGDSVSINSVGVADPDFTSTGQVSFTDTSNTITANITDDTIVEADLDAANAPSGAGDYLTYDGSGGFQWTTSTAGDSVAEGDSIVEVVDTGTGQIDFTLDGVNLVRMTEIVGGTYHAFLGSQAAATRFSMGAASGVGNDKYPRIHFVPDDDVATAIRGTALFDYGSGTVDVLGTADPHFNIAVNNSTDGGSSVDTTQMLRVWRDEGVMLRAADVAADVSDTNIVLSTCTFSQNEATNSLVIRCKESGGTINTFTIAAD